jgi:hypothetical protein
MSEADTLGHRKRMNQVLRRGGPTLTLRGYHMGYTTVGVLGVALSPFLSLACAGSEPPTGPTGRTGVSLSVERTIEEPVLSERGAAPGIFLFYECVGPAGTPASFTAEKIELPLPALPAFAQATAYQLTDGSATFLALIRGDRHHPPGMDASGIADTSCLVDTPIGTLLFSGFLAPAP